MKSYKVLIESVNHRCGPNLIDCARLYNYLIKNEHVVINNVSEADYIIINSCGFINEQKDRSINFFKKYNVIKKKNAKIIMYGCLVNINKDLFKNLDLIQIGINENHKFDKIFYKATKFELVKPYCKSELNDILFKDNISYTFRGRIPLLLTKIFIPFSKKLKINYNHILNAISYRNLNFIEISKGCTGNCSFCAIKKAKGKIYSRNKDDIISDIKEIYDTTKPLFLVADDCSSFGIDIDSNLIELIYEINKNYPNLEINLNYLSPTSLERDYIKYIELFKKVKIGFLIFPIQSGSQKLIKKMNRNYDIVKVLKIVDYIKKISPYTIFQAVFIVGHPEETTFDFIKTLFVAKHFDYPIVFKYSDIKGTASYNMHHKVSQPIILIRWTIFTIFINFIILHNLSTNSYMVEGLNKE